MTIKKNGWGDIVVKMNGVPISVPDDVTEFVRAGGDVICPKCGKMYKKHKQHDKHPWLNVLCDGTLVKL